MLCGSSSPFAAIAVTHLQLRAQITACCISAALLIFLTVACCVALLLPPPRLRSHSYSGVLILSNISNAAHSYSRLLRLLPAVFQLHY
jgi:hypothetical protein